MNKLNALLADAQALEEKAEQDRQAAMAAQCEAARCAVAGAFGDLWAELAPYADAGNVWTSNGQVTTYWTVIQAPGLAPFSAAVQNNHGNAAPFLVPHTSPESGWTRSGFQDLPEFLLASKRSHDEIKAKVTEKRIEELRAKLAGHNSQLVPNIAQADAVLAELTYLAPDNAQKWAELHVDWKLWSARKDAQDRAERAEKERQAALADEYEAAYRTYHAELQRVMAINAARLDALQAEMDVPFSTWELTYGIAGQNEDGDRFADTCSVYVLADGPDEEGYWATIHHHSIVRKRFYNIVSLAAPVECRPSADDDVCSYVAVGAPGDHYWRKIYFHPAGAGDKELIHAQALELLEPWPDRPEPPEDLDARTVGDIRRKVVGQATGDYDVDIPF